MPKTFVLDTNVLIHAPYAIESFEDNNVVLPVAVLEELDGLKTSEGECGANAREVVRKLERLRQSGNLLEGVTVGNGGRLWIELNHVDVALPHGFQANSADNRILKTCIGLAEKGLHTVLISRDIIVRIKAGLMGISAEDFTTDQITPQAAQYTGRGEVFLPEKKVKTFKEKGVKPEDVYVLDEQGEQSAPEIINNQFLVLKPDGGTSKGLLGRHDGARIVPLQFQSVYPIGVRPRNLGQRFLQEALLLPPEKAPLVIVKGAAGTAKTFYALAAGLEQIIGGGEPLYQKILVCRPNAQFDDEIGFLPGTEQEKISPLLRPVMDNLEILLSSGDSCVADRKNTAGKIDYLFKAGIICAEAMNFIRGRSITHTYLIIDEAQNLTPKQVKGIITRVGKGTKVVLLGDPAQIDNPMLNDRTNGLSYAAERMRGSLLCCQITMSSDECERSELAQDAARRM
ncbi:MAG TPA: PhoH family protein [Clostridia bacterium]|nr:PhoH family protein [Clostridia bacterium]